MNRSICNGNGTSRRQPLHALLLAIFAIAVSLSAIPTSSLLLAQDSATGIVILPADFELRGPDSLQRLLVHEVDVASTDSGTTMVGPAIAPQAVTWTSSDPGIVEVIEGIAIPRGNGNATLVADHNGRSATATVLVSGFDQPTAWSFRHDVLPIFSRLGCNSGACHGALAGKGGFRLSLQGYDPLSDHHTITRQARGRRIELSDPGASLLLTKPTGAVPHKGGVRLSVDSLDYRILSEWITTGAAAPADTDPQVSRIEILPPQTRLPIGSSMQVTVMAHFDDGTIRDVTSWAKITSTDEAIAKVDATGKVEVIGPGSGALSAWYSSRVTLGRVLVPYDQTIPAATFAEAPRANLIDELVLERLQVLQLPPSPRSGDAEFLRRVHLDTIGRLPTIEETRAFLADSSPDKRQRLIDGLLEREEFTDYWTYKWSDLLLINGTRLRPDAVKAFYNWVRSNVERNVPWDQFARQIVTAKGSATLDGATNFYALHQDPETMTENVSQAFLGLSINCAKCHNHPLEKWTNDQYYAMANLFARVRAKGWGGDPRGGDGQRTVYVVDSGELIQPLRGVPQPPTPLDGTPLNPSDPRDRREYLADWLTAAENPYFARAITNRVWANFFGIGLIEPVDDLRASNPASDERLLTALANHLIEHHYDLKEVMRLILRSETYQRSSQVLPENAADRRSFSRYYPRRLMAEVLLDAVSDITQVPTDFNQIEFPGADFAATDFYPKGTRAIELYDSAVQSYFLKAFGRNTRDITCECERSNEPSMVQVLHLSNGTTVNGKLAMAGNRIDQWITAGASDEQIVREAFLLCVCREPDDRELAELLALLAEETDERRVRVEDLVWSLMTTREFLFNH